MENLGLLTQLPENIVDPEDVRQRFCDALHIWERYVRRFPQQCCLEALCRAVEADDRTNVSILEHELRGLVSTLGFTTLTADCQRLADVYHHDGTQQQMAACMRQLMTDYQEVVHAIDAITGAQSAPRQAADR